MKRTRAATLVVVDGDGVLQGQLAPITVDLPWWQEAGPIVDAVGSDEAIVLRLLQATPDIDQPMGGQVTYLVELSREAVQSAGLTLLPVDRAFRDVLADHPMRHRWASVGGPTADLDWVSANVEVAGRPRQHRTWNLSAVWSIPTIDGTVWLKCVPPFFGHEVAVLEQLADLPVPRLIAADGHRILMAAMQGEDGYDPNETEQRAMVTTLVDIQIGAADRIDTLIAAGVPDLRSSKLIAELTALVQRLAPNSGPLRRLIDQLPERLGGAAEALPDTLVHGDPHGGNCRRGTNPPIWFDWGDSFIGSPLLDVAATHRMGPAAVNLWLDRLALLSPGADPHSAWRQLEPVATLRMAWVYQRFLDNIEDAEHIYHRDDVPQVLEQVTAMMNTG